MITDTRSTGFSVAVAVAISLVLSAGLLANVSFMYGIAFFIPGFAGRGRRTLASERQPGETTANKR